MGPLDRGHAERQDPGTLPCATRTHSACGDLLSGRKAALPPSWLQSQKLPGRVCPPVCQPRLEQGGSALQTPSPWVRGPWPAEGVEPCSRGAAETSQAQAGGRAQRSVQ